MHVTSMKSKNLNIPWKEGNPDGHGRLSLRGKGDEYIGNVVKGSISHNDTLGCLSPAVDSSQPTCISGKLNFALHGMADLAYKI